MPVLLCFSCTLMPTAPRARILVEGRISGAAGEPLARATVAFVPDESVGLDFEDARTDSLGQYAVQLLSGRYQVHVLPPDGYSTPAHRDRVKFEAPRSRYDFAINVHPITGPLSGPPGKPSASGR